jgi:asparaginyl-tRNA synthetase
VRPRDARIVDRDRGTVRKDDRAPAASSSASTDFTIVHLAGEYPIQPKEHGVEFLFDHRHLYLRSRTPQSVIKVRNEVIQPAAISSTSATSC